MIYLPSMFGRWWTCPQLGVPRPTTYHKRIGWWNDDIRQATFDEYLEINAYEFERALYQLIPLEKRVLEALAYRGFSQSELETFCSGHQNALVLHPNCTLKTALRRLLKRQLIVRELHARGWFQWYVYDLNPDRYQEIWGYLYEAQM